MNEDQQNAWKQSVIELLNKVLEIMRANRTEINKKVGYLEESEVILKEEIDKFKDNTTIKDLQEKGINNTIMNIANVQFSDAYSKMLEYYYRLGIVSYKKLFFKAELREIDIDIETVQNYIANSVNLDGVRAEEIKKSLIAEVQDEMNHAQTIAKRIKEIGGQVPGSMEFRSSQKSLQPPSDTTDVVSVIKGVIDAENEAIDGYNQLIKDCDGIDYVTQDLVITLLADEESHRTIFEGYLKEYSK